LIVIEIITNDKKPLLFSHITEWINVLCLKHNNVIIIYTLTFIAFAWTFRFFFKIYMGGGEKSEKTARGCLISARQKMLMKAYVKKTLRCKSSDIFAAQTTFQKNVVVQMV